jgi:hypothetical protein
MEVITTIDTVVRDDERMFTFCLLQKGSGLLIHGLLKDKSESVMRWYRIYRIVLEDAIFGQRGSVL